MLQTTELLMKLWEGFPSPFNSPNEILLQVLHPIINQQKMCPEVTTCFEKLKSIAEEGQFYERKDNGGCDAHSKQTLCSQISTAPPFAFSKTSFHIGLKPTRIVFEFLKSLNALKVCVLFQTSKM